MRGRELNKRNLFYTQGGSIALIIDTNNANEKVQKNKKSHWHLLERVVFYNTSLRDRTWISSKAVRNDPKTKEFKKKFKKVVDKRLKLWYSKQAVARTTTKNLENWTVCKTLKILVKWLRFRPWMRTFRTFTIKALQRMLACIEKLNVNERDESLVSKT